MKKLVVYLALVLVLSLSFVIPCFAVVGTSGNTITWDGALDNSVLFFQDSSGSLFAEWVSPTFLNMESVLSGLDGTSFYAVSSYNEVDGLGSLPVSIDSSSFVQYSSGLWVLSDIIWFVPSSGTYTLNGVSFTLPHSGIYFLRIDYSATSYEYVDELCLPGFTFESISDLDAEPTGIYWDIFDIMHTHIYGGVELSSDMNLVLTMLSTTACVFCFAVPFLIVFWVIKRWL